MNLNRKNLKIDDKIKLFFWLNIPGICNFLDKKKYDRTQEAHTSDISKNVFKHYEFCSVVEKKNGFKLMNSDNDMMDLILPDLDNKKRMNEESKIDSAIHKREDEKMELVNPNNLIDLK